MVFHIYSLDAGGVYGSTLNPKDIMAHVLIAKECMSAGVPLNALDNPTMRNAFLHFGVRLASATRLKNHIPFINEEEVRQSSFLMQSIRTPQRDTCRQATLNILPRDPGKRKPYLNMPNPDHVRTGEDDTLRAWVWKLRGGV